MRELIARPVPSACLSERDTPTVAELEGSSALPGEVKGLIASGAERGGHHSKDPLPVDDLELIAGRQVRELVHGGAPALAPFLAFCFMIASTLPVVVSRSRPRAGAHE